MATQPPPGQKGSKTKKWLTLLLKVAVTVLCFWYISRKINFAQAFEALKTANWLFLFLTVLAYVLSKLVAAFRLNIYFDNINLRLPHWRNIKLYWLGMFYNLFLPGSISGDAYKVVILNKRFGAPYKKTSAAVLLDRFSGLLGLGVLLCLYGVPVFDNSIYDAVLIAGCLFAIAALYFTIRFFFPDFCPASFQRFSGGLLCRPFRLAEYTSSFQPFTFLPITSSGSLFFWQLLSFRFYRFRSAAV